tara:strand:+ start:53 stop:256 length:204 start_codon:yes stop_codon:yes gene_type:complete
MIKKIVFFLVLLTFASCGYSPIHLKKNENSFIVKDFQLDGNKKIGRKIITALDIENEIDYKKKHINY